MEIIHVWLRQYLCYSQQQIFYGKIPSPLTHKCHSNSIKSDEEGERLGTPATGVLKGGEHISGAFLWPQIEQWYYYGEEAKHMQYQYRDLNSGQCFAKDGVHGNAYEKDGPE